jgi:transposase
MKKVKFSLGIDVSSNFFTITILSSTLEFIAKAEYFMTEFHKFSLWLKENKVTKKNCHIVMEATGVYTEQLCLYLHNHGFSFSVACPLKVKAAFGTKVNMDDWIASRCIAEYGIRFSDKLVQWQPPNEVLEQVKMLLSFREQLVKNKTAYKNRIHAIKKKIVQSKSIIETTKQLIERTEQAINEVEKEIKSLLKSNTNLGSMYLRLITVPGVQMLLAAELLVLTNGFTKTIKHKEIAGYLGICPAKKQSGKDIHRKAKSTGRGPKRLRKLVFLASGSLSHSNKIFNTYAQRKKLQGKEPMVILNNIANKVIKIVCGVIKSGKPFIKNYQSLSPALAV